MMAKFMEVRRMHRFMLAVVGLGMLAASAPAAAAGLAEAAELEHARANARAGGPVSERDAELLERYGCLSGTESAFCRHLNHRMRYRADRRHAN
jgi:hypothetical protein